MTSRWTRCVNCAGGREVLCACTGIARDKRQKTRAAEITFITIPSYHGEKLHPLLPVITIVRAFGKKSGLSLIPRRYLNVRDHTDRHVITLGAWQAPQVP